MPNGQRMGAGQWDMNISFAFSPTVERTRTDFSVGKRILIVEDHISFEFAILSANDGDGIAGA